MWLSEIESASRRAGKHFFDADTRRFFRSRFPSERVYSGAGGVYFVSSERFTAPGGSWPRRYTVRQFHPASGDVTTAGTFQEYGSQRAAERAALGLSCKVSEAEAVTA